MWKVGDVARNGRGGLSVWIQCDDRRRQASRLICLCVASSRRSSRNTSGIGSSERTFGASPRRLGPNYWIGAATTRHPPA
jgi:hypothetical protein